MRAYIDQSSLQLMKCLLHQPSSLWSKLLVTSMIPSLGYREGWSHQDLSNLLHQDCVETQNCIFTLYTWSSDIRPRFNMLCMAQELARLQIQICHFDARHNKPEAADLRRQKPFHPYVWSIFVSSVLCFDTCTNISSLRTTDAHHHTHMSTSSNAVTKCRRRSSFSNTAFDTYTGLGFV